MVGNEHHGRDRRGVRAWVQRRDEWQRLVPFIGAGLSVSTAPCLYGTLGQVTKSFRKDLQNKGYEIDDSWELPIVVEAWLLHVARGDHAELVDRYLGWNRLSHRTVHGQWRAHWPHAREIPYLPLKDYIRALLAAAPLSFAGAQPAGPNVVLARLMREGWVRTIVTTNFDALIELGAFLVGMRVLDGEDLDAIRGGGADMDDSLAAGTHEHLVVLEPVADSGGQRWTGGRMAYLLKIHGGIRHVEQALCAHPLRPHRLSPDLVLVTHSRMLRYQASSWQDTVLNELYLHGRLLLIGASGRDAVTFRLVREAQRLARRQGQQGRFTAPRDLFEALRHPPTVAWSYGGEKNSKSGRIENPGLALELLLVGDETQQGSVPLPMAHVTNTDLALKGIFAAAAAQSLTRLLWGAGLRADGDSLLKHSLELVAEIDRIVCVKKGPSNRRDFERLERWLDVYCLALPRWGTLSKAQGHALFLHHRGQVRPLGPWFTLPFLNDAEERLHTLPLHRSGPVNRLVFYGVLLAGLLKEVYAKHPEWLLDVDPYLGALTVDISGIVVPGLGRPALVQAVPLYLAPGTRIGGLHAVGARGFAPRYGAQRRLAVLEDPWRAGTGPLPIAEVKGAADRGLDFLLGRSCRSRSRTPWLPLAGQVWASCTLA